MSELRMRNIKHKHKHKDVHLSDLATLVVSSQNGDTVTVSDLEGNKQGDSLHRVVATINVVAHEEVVSVGGLAADTEKLHQVVELTMNVTTHGNGTLDRLHILFLDEDFTGLWGKHETKHKRRRKGLKCQLIIYKRIIRK